MAITAPFCMKEGCGNRTWNVYCHQHPNGGTAPSSEPRVTKIASPYIPIQDNKFPTHESLSDLWSSASRVFPDLADVIHPTGLREQAINTIKAAVSNETYRLFPLVDVQDFQDREDRVASARSYITDELSLVPLAITDDEALEISHSSSDQYGRAIDDSGALASYAIRLEWETANILKVDMSPDGVRYDIPFPEFCELTSQHISNRVDTEYRKQLSGFESFILENFNRPPLNVAEIAPSLRLPADEEPWNADPVQEEQVLMDQHNQILQQQNWEREEAQRREREREQTKENLKNIASETASSMWSILRGGDTPEERRKNKEAAKEARRRESEKWDAKARADMQEKANKAQYDFYQRANNKRRF